MLIDTAPGTSPAEPLPPAFQPASGRLAAPDAPVSISGQLGRLPPSPSDIAEAIEPLLGLARTALEDLDATPPSRRTARRFGWLAAVTGHDVVLGKLFESHLDALAIAAELRAAPALESAAAGLWCVWAAEGPGGRSLAFTTRPDGSLRIDGRKQWCSGAPWAAGALVTGRDEADRRCMAAVPLRGPGVRVTDEGWNAVGMQRTGSVDVDFDDARGWPVGAPGAYLDRPGFWHGGAGIAACWHGGAAAIAATLRTRLAAQGDSDAPHASAHLGAIDAALAGSRALLEAAAQRIDAGVFGHRDALQARAATEAAAALAIDRCGRALGAPALCRDAAHAQRAADLAVFLRQSHAEWDLAVLGQMTAAAGAEDAWSL
jgi:alkylation response protein AidB-like acyl-CoA dehydrogenase